MKVVNNFSATLIAITLAGFATYVGSAGAATENETSVNLGVPLPSEIKNAGQLNIAIKCDSPGFGFDFGGEIIGLEIDMARQLGVYAFGNESKVNLECVTADNRVPYLSSGRVDMVMATLGITPGRSKAITFSEPYMASTGEFLVVKGEGFETLGELEGKVVTDAGAPWIDWMNECIPNAEAVTLSGEATQLQALSNGKVSAVLADSTLLANIVSKNDGFEIVGPYLPQLGFSWGVGMKKEDDELEAWVNAALNKMQEDDVFWKSIKSVMPNEDVQEVLEAAIRRPGYTPEYKKYLFSYQAVDSSVPCE